MKKTDWLPCLRCGATTRHDDGICIRDRRHPYVDRTRFTHDAQTPTFRDRQKARQVAQGWR